MSYSDYLKHHGIKGQKWGQKEGPPYPLTDAQRSAKENRLNPTSASARKMITDAGTGKKISYSGSGASSKSVSGGGGASSNAEKRPSNNNEAQERTSGKNYHDTLTSNRRLEMLKAKNPDKFGEKKFIPVQAKESKSSSKSSSQKSAEKAAKDAAKARKESLNKWYEDGKAAVDDAFNEDTNTRTFSELLEKFYKGAFENGFDGKKDAELEKKYDEDGNEIERTEGEKFYEKIMSRLDKNSKDYNEFKSRYDEIMNDTELSSMKRLSKSISLLSDYAYSLDENESNSDTNRVYAKMLNYLDNKLKWYSEKMTPSSKSKLNIEKIMNHEEIENYLKKNGF